LVEARIGAVLLAEMPTVAGGVRVGVRMMVGAGEMAETCGVMAG
jgi:hypothetical protein